MVDILPGVSSTASALNAERVRMDVISENIANAHTTRGVDGKAYQRQQVVFETVLAQHQQSAGSPGIGAGNVAVARVEKDPRPAQLVYSPGHPDADGNGMVAMPNVNVYEEMVDLMGASRAFEANLAVFKNARTLALQTLAIGKRS
jgi:flagellar basal-body rod protein FlgC